MDGDQPSDQESTEAELTEDEFPNNDAYKSLKNEVLRIFGPRPEQGMERALNRTLVGKPSNLARALVSDVCKRQLDCPCCPDNVAHLWKRQLSSTVRAGIAHAEFSKANFNAITQLADDIHSNTTVPQVAAMLQNMALPQSISYGCQELS